DGGGRVLMPGLIDLHVHLLFSRTPQELLAATPWVHGLWAAKAAEAVLLRGFTTVRDAGGIDGSLRRLIDAGEVGGPRLFPSGPPLSQTSGHGDHRFLSDGVPGGSERPGSFRGMYWLVNGVP